MRNKYKRNKQMNLFFKILVYRLFGIFLIACGFASLGVGLILTFSLHLFGFTFLDNAILLSIFGGCVNLAGGFYIQFQMDKQDEKLRR